MVAYVAKVYYFPQIIIELTYNYLIADMFKTPNDILTNAAKRSLVIQDTSGQTITLTYSSYTLSIVIGNVDLNLIGSKTVTFALNIVDGTDYYTQYTMTKKAQSFAFVYYLEFQANPTIANSQVILSFSKIW